jgi:hypothetical protein
MVKKDVLTVLYVGHVFIRLLKDDALYAMIAGTATFGASAKCVMVAAMVRFYLNA